MLDNPQPRESRAREIAPDAPNATVIDVLVAKTGTGSHPNEITCSITGKPGSEHYVTGNKISLPSFAGPFEIKFQLAGDLDWQDHDAFNTQKGNCPPRGTHCKDQIWLQPPNGKELSILNLNGGQKCKVHYRMNFADGTYCDPIMDNGGNSIEA